MTVPDVNSTRFGTCWCNHDGTTGGHQHNSADGGNVPQQQMSDLVPPTYQDLRIRVRTLERRNRKLQERLNRISNAMVGNQRIWQLDRLAMECEVEADLAVAEYNLDEDIPHVSVDSRLAIEREARCRADALFIRRLEWDLGELHVAVRGDTNRRGGRYDQSQWRGQRP